MNLRRTVFGAASALLLLLCCAHNAHSEPVYRTIDHQGQVVEMEPDTGYGAKRLPPSWTAWAPDPSETGIFSTIQPDGTKLLTDLMFRDEAGDRIPVWTCKGGQRYHGFVDRNGKLAIPPVYSYSRGFANGFAAVSKTGEFKIIDTTGRERWTLPRGFYPSSICDIVDTDSNGFMFLLRDSDKTSAIFNCNTGKFSLLAPDTYPMEFSEGLCSVGSGLGDETRYSYVNIDGKQAFPGEFKWGGNFHRGLAPVRLLDGKYAYIDKQGKVAIKLPDSCGLAEEFSDTEGLAAIALGVARNERNDKVAFAHAKWAFIDTKGKTVIQARYPVHTNYYGSLTRPGFHEGLAAVTDNKGQFGYIDKRGSWAILPQFSEANSFEHGRALVAFGKKAFSRQNWQAGIGCRLIQLELFAKQWKLLGMDRSTVLSFLGAPTHKYKDEAAIDTYEQDPGSANIYKYLIQIHYNKQGFADKYRSVDGDMPTPWVTK